MPDRFRRMQRGEWADANRAGAPVDSFLEGPCFDAAGRLHVVDIPYGRIFRIDGDDWTLIAEYDGWPNGLQVQPDGSLLAADYRRGLVRIDAGSGQVVHEAVDRADASSRRRAVRGEEPGGGAHDPGFDTQEGQQGDYQIAGGALFPRGRNDGNPGRDLWR